jgi:hypothetical protein
MSGISLVQIHHKGLNVLVEKLRNFDTSRFIQIYDLGSGEYTNDKHTSLSDDPDEIFSSITKQRKESE